MKITSKYTLGFKRKRKGLTDYRKRLKILMSKKPRLVIRKSIKNIQASIVEYTAKGDIIKITVHSSQLNKLGWKYGTGNIPAAYLVGFMAGKKAASLGVEEAVLDIGLQKAVRGSRLFAVLAGAIDAGLNIPHGEDVLPNKERIAGMHIKKYAESMKGNNDAGNRQFGSQIKNGEKPEQINSVFEKVKAEIGKK